MTMMDPFEPFEAFVSRQFSGLWAEIRSFRMSFEDTVTNLENARAAEHAAIVKQIEQVQDKLAEIATLTAQIANQPELQARINAVVDAAEEDIAAMAADDEPAGPPAQP